MPERLIDTICLSGNRSIMVSHVSGGVSMFKEMTSPKKSLDIAKFGLFGGSNNYNTYYPDAQVKDFNPSEDEFIEPVFRLLSACIVSKNWLPTEFPEDVLKASMNLLVGQTVNCDHETDVANAIGSVADVEWQESYTVNGVTVPAGINGLLKIDARSNPRIARGIMMDPPSVHSNSVTVQFEWKPSHEIGGEDLPDLYAFYDKLGQYDASGNMYRRIATKIIAYRETSLVSHGADPFAQKVVKGKIVNPVYADRVYSSYREVPDEVRHSMLVEGNIMYNSEDTYKAYTMAGVIDDEKDKHDTTIYINKQTNSENMEDFNKFLDSLFGEGMLTLREGAEITQETALSALKDLVASNSTLKETNASLQEKLDSKESEITSLNEKVTELTSQVEEFKEMAGIGTSHLKEVRDNTLASYQKLMGDQVDNNIVALIEANTTNLATLLSLKAGYDKQLDEKFPMTCSDCGSHNVTRGSALVEKSDDRKDESSNSEVDDTTAAINRVKSKKILEKN